MLAIGSFLSILLINQPILLIRQRKDKAGLAKMSNNVTDQLLTISRNLADTTQRSAETLETLGMCISFKSLRKQLCSLIIIFVIYSCDSSYS